MIQVQDIRTVDLKDGLLLENGLQMYAASDVKAHKIGAVIQYGGAAVDLTGATCQGVFVRPDGATITLTGTVTGSTASVELTGACYLFDGAFTLALTVTQSGVTSTVRFIRGRVTATSTEIIGEGGTYSLAQLMALINAKLSAPAADGENGYVLTTDGAGGVSWQDVSAGNVAGTVKVNDTAYTLRTGSAGAAGYLTFVTEA